MLVITADRPPELHGTGANQTIDQRGLFGSAAVAVEFPVAERRDGQNQVWRGLVCRAVAQAEAGRPVQVNIPFREPLVPTFEPRWPEPLDGRPNGLRWTTSAAPVTMAGSRVDFRATRKDVDGLRQRPRGPGRVRRPRWPPARDGRRSPSRPGRRRRWPAARTSCAAARCCLRPANCPEPLRPEAVVVVGRPTLSRGVRGLMGRAPVYGIGDHPQWTDPQYVATHVRGWLDLDDMSHVDAAGPRVAADLATRGHRRRPTPSRSCWQNRNGRRDCGSRPR